MNNQTDKCTCLPGFVDSGCPVHRHEADRAQLERDLRRIPKRNRQAMIDDEDKLTRCGGRP